MRPLAAALVLVSVCAVIGQAQSARDPSNPATSTITLNGRVVAAASGDPLRNARVTIVSGGSPSILLTDGEGRFAFTALPTARYSLSASKSGYVRVQVSASGEGPIVEIRLQRGATISGRIFDAGGEPVPGIRVAAETPTRFGSNISTVATAETDDRGEYRLAGLSAGDVAVSVSVAPTLTIEVSRTSAGPRRQKTYYPAALNISEAKMITVEPGVEQRGIDFVVPLNYSTAFTSSMIFAQRVLPEDAHARVTGIIRGRIVSTDGRPLARAQVFLRPEESGAALLTSPQYLPSPRLVTADEDGRYDFSGLPAGTYTASAEKLGYFTLVGRPIALADGEVRERVDLTLAHWGALSGRVYDEYGDPIEGASVQVLQLGFEGGRRRLVTAGVTPRLTDDLGRFRLFGLQPGRYVVSATIGQGASADVPGYARVYFPGTPNSSEAQFVLVGPSQELVGLEFSLSRVPTALVAGKAVNSAGEPTTAASVDLVPSQQSVLGTSVAVGARLLPNGSFEFPNVPPGQYVIQAYSGRANPSTEGEFGALPIAVNGDDVTGLVLRTSSGSTIQGRFTFDDANPPSGTIDLSPLPVDSESSPSAAEAVAHAFINTSDWTFEMSGISGVRRLQLTETPKGWALKAVRVNGLDVTDTPLPFGRKEQSLREVEVVLTSRVTQLNGIVADDRARPGSSSTVIVFSVDRDRWHTGSRFLRRTLAGWDGAFSVIGLPPGDYYVRSIERVPVAGEDSWQDPEFLESLALGASRVALIEGEITSLSLQVAR